MQAGGHSVAEGHERRQKVLLPADRDHQVEDRGKLLHIVLRLDPGEIRLINRRRIRHEV